MTEHRRHVRLRPDDPANAVGSHSPLFGVSLSYFGKLRRVAPNTLNAAAHRHEVDLSDPWDLARWTLEGLAVRRLQAQGVKLALARVQARADVEAMLAPIRELLATPADPVRRRGAK